MAEEEELAATLPTEQEEEMHAATQPTECEEDEGPDHFAMKEEEFLKNRDDFRDPVVFLYEADGQEGAEGVRCLAFPAEGCDISVGRSEGDIVLMNYYKDPTMVGDVSRMPFRLIWSTEGAEVEREGPGNPLFGGRNSETGTPRGELLPSGPGKFKIDGRATICFAKITIEFRNFPKRDPSGGTASGGAAAEAAPLRQENARGAADGSQPTRPTTSLTLEAVEAGLKAKEEERYQAKLAEAQEATDLGDLDRARGLVAEARQMKEDTPRAKRGRGDDEPTEGLATKSSKRQKSKKGQDAAGARRSKSGGNPLDEFKRMAKRATKVGKKKKSSSKDTAFMAKCAATVCQYQKLHDTEPAAYRPCRFGRQCFFSHKNPRNGQKRVVFEGCPGSITTWNRKKGNGQIKLADSELLFFRASAVQDGGNVAKGKQVDVEDIYQDKGRLRVAGKVTVM